MKLNIFIDLLQRIMKDINRKGLIDAVKIYLLKIDTRIFDYKYNVNTHKDSYLKDLKFNSINKKEACDYETIAIFSIKKILNNIEIDKKDIFVDFGCGKGRVLLIASRYNFNKIIGIEFSPELISIALANIERCKNYSNFSIDKIKIIEEDVLHYNFSNNETVFYLYNPFSNIILNRLCENIVKSFISNPRRILIIYVNPNSRTRKFHNLIIDKGFIKIHNVNLINKMCYIYSKQ